MTTTPPRHIAILGGGIAGLTTAFELTSQPGWQERYRITLYQMGWRLGGKCATGRGPHGRIQEHGIHGFLGCYYNALPMMRAVYEALGRPPGAPLATFDEAFKPEDFVLMWEYRSAQWKAWPFEAPSNSLTPDDAASLPTLRHWLARVIDLVERVFDKNEEQILGGSNVLARTAESAIGHRLIHELKEALEGALERGAGLLLTLLDKAWQWLAAKIEPLVDDNDTLRRAWIAIDYLLALVRGTIADDILEKGFDSIDEEDFAAWLRRHGAAVMTVSSPLALNTVNLSYQYPAGDTARPPTMAAGAYLHWSLRSFAYLGAFAWLFEAGTGETVIAPLYQVLAARGVRFEFFHKVEALVPDAAGTRIERIEIGVQATAKNPQAGYEPLIEVKRLPSWPAEPLLEQLVEGEALAGIDLESWWNGWPPVAHKTLVAGTDFDDCVFAISIGAVPYLCGAMLAQNEAWRGMVKHVKTVQTQTMQLWLERTTPELGWTIPLKHPDDIVIGATYVNPLDGQVDFSHLLKWEAWPEARMPKSLWYFSGAMADYGPVPPFTDTQYPARAAERVKAQCIQYLQASIGPLWPKATTNAVNPPGDPIGFDFSLLETGEPADPREGVARFDSQFWRANIDPTERYVTSPPGSTKFRLKAWGSGYSNLVLAGDWIYTGLNVGSVEGTVMGGRLASHALTGVPALADIIGYPASEGPAVRA
jgi:uncharacterized protein with NAD-binding domain and iron-sulfur cluster